MQLTKKYETRLETAVENGDSIATILDNKVAHYQENNMPVEGAVADYIALGIQGQKDKIEQYKQYKKDLDAAIKELEALEKGFAHKEETIRDIPSSIRINKRKSAWVSMKN